MKSQFTDLGRRQFMERFASLCLGVRIAANPALAQAAASGGKAKSVICLYMRGGISHIDTFDPKPGKPEMAGVKAIKTSADDVQISEWFPRFAKQMHHVTLVRSMTSTQGIHELGAYSAHTSYFMTPTIKHPAMGSWALKLLGSKNKVLPGNVLINGSPQHPGCGYMESHLAPLPIVDPAAGLQNSAMMNGFSVSDADRRTALAQAMGARFVDHTPHRDVGAYLKIQKEAAALMKSEDLKVFDISQENEKTREAYGKHTFGQGCLLARRLVEAGVRFIEVEDDQNWDTHNDQIESMENMTPSADQTMATLLDDLHQRGLLQNTLVMMITEFGRTPRINEATAGRGHHPGVFTWWLAGGGMKGGYAHGLSDEIGERVAEKPVTMPDFNATVAMALGMDLAHVEHSPSGRPFTVADKGKPVMELFA
ncbi:DUF1501 domain-containing protein [Brevifollis gellanilyticus]|uniref:Sulfatase n=1 Tax=Brevifollis gellanilyticus TaxID=748831 RepID=A0A512MCS2_9BACT|nr:DUF1501 domain-containing protein [Brevifollis gellanilyticus]GEP44502.1 hypothetical protein BGE01nite_37930 [Brevifollis gellanilyticus]